MKNIEPEEYEIESFDGCLSMKVEMTSRSARLLKIATDAMYDLPEELRVSPWLKSLLAYSVVAETRITIKDSEQSQWGGEVDGEAE